MSHLDLEMQLNPLIEKLAEEGGQEQIVSIEGYLGKGEDETIRLYKDLNLGKYLEVPRQSVLAVEQTAPGIKQKTTLYVEASTAIKSTRILTAYAVANPLPDKQSPEVCEDFRELDTLISEAIDKVDKIPRTFENSDDLDEIKDKLTDMAATVYYIISLYC